MAPGPKLPSDSPMGKDVKHIVREMLTKELRLMVWNNTGETVSVQLKLGKEWVGKEFRIDTSYLQDHGHGGGWYVNGLKVEEVI